MTDQHDSKNHKVGKDADSEHIEKADSIVIKQSSDGDSVSDDKGKVSSDSAGKPQPAVDVSKSLPAAAASSEPAKYEPGKDVSGERQRVGRSRAMTLSSKELALVLASAGAGGMGVMMAEENEQEREERRHIPKD